MPTFCRHNRFLDRCPICGKSQQPAGVPKARRSSARGAGVGRDSTTGSSGQRRSRGEQVRVRREGRAEDDGFNSTLVPGIRASADASRLAEEIAFSSGRLLALSVEPPGMYAQVRSLAREDLERATWTCFLLVYLSPLQDAEDPFEGIREAIDSTSATELPDLEGIPLGPRTYHDPARGVETLSAYRQWVERAGDQEMAFGGDPAWSPQRRFERLFERLALPGFARMGRYELLVTLGRLGLYELQAGSLQLAGARGLSAEDLTTLAAKRMFGIGDPILLDRRAAALAEAVSVPVEALDLALANWASPQRVTLGFSAHTSDSGAHERAIDALGL